MFVPLHRTQVHYRNHCAVIDVQNLQDKPSTHGSLSDSFQRQQTVQQNQNSTHTRVRVSTQQAHGHKALASCTYTRTHSIHIAARQKTTLPSTRPRPRPRPPPQYWLAHRDITQSWNRTHSVLLLLFTTSIRSERRFVRAHFVSKTFVKLPIIHIEKLALLVLHITAVHCTIVRLIYTILPPPCRRVAATSTSAVRSSVPKT